MDNRLIMWLWTTHSQTRMCCVANSCSYVILLVAIGPARQMHSQPLGMSGVFFLFRFFFSFWFLMASNAMSRIENRDRTCLVQILLSHTFLPWSFCTEKHKITLLAFCSQKQTECESHFKWFCTSLVKSLTLTLISPSSVLSSSPRVL